MEFEAALSQVRHGVWWDAFVIDPDVPVPQSLWGAKLFGNVNIGNHRLTNLVVGGQFNTSDQAVILQRWFARTDLPRDSYLVESWASSATVDLRSIGPEPHPLWEMHLSELFARRPRYDAERAELRHAFDPWPAVLAPRSECQVWMGMQPSETEALFNYVRTLDRTCHVWIVFEGLHVPREISQQVMVMLNAARAGTAEVHTRIVEYILGYSSKCDNPFERALLEVVADGIRQLWDGL